MKKFQYWCDNCGRQFDNIPYDIIIKRLDSIHGAQDTVLLSRKEFCSTTCLVEFVQRVPWG